MTVRSFLRLLPLALFAPDALAWGLQTHVFFAQYALALVPLADPQLRAAAARLPRLVLAGACLPDLAVVGRFFLGAPVFRRPHLWDTLRRISAAPRDDHDRALALGYATHLLSDVIAHNHFVPEHETRIGRSAMIAHLVSEWAMDAHVGVDTQPADALEEAGWHAARAHRRSVIASLDPPSPASTSTCAGRFEGCKTWSPRLAAATRTGAAQIRKEAAAMTAPIAAPASTSLG